MVYTWEISIGDIIAFASLLGSIWAYYQTKDMERESKESNEAAKKYYDLMVEQINSKKAEKAYCDANVVKIGRNEWLLKIFNKGITNATNVTFKYLITEAPSITGLTSEPFLIKLLEPQKNVDFHLGVNLDLRSTSWEYEITWTNEDGSAASKIGVLTLPLS